MKKIRVGIIENEECSRQRLVNCINLWAKNKHYDIKYFMVTSDKEIPICEFVDMNIIFMDIKFYNGVNGITFAEQLRNQNYIGEIVFVTAFLEYALDGYKVYALNYLLKPVVLSEVEFCMDTVCQKLKKNYYLLHNQNSFIKIPYSNIIYFSSAKHYVDIVSTGQIYRQRIAFKEVLPTLPSNFMQCHRTTIINIQHVNSVDGNNITMSNKNILPVSKTYVEQIRFAFINSVSSSS